jgi:hypothetical protein
MTSPMQISPHPNMVVPMHPGEGHYAPPSSPARDRGAFEHGYAVEGQGDGQREAQGVGLHRARSLSFVDNPKYASPAQRSVPPRMERFRTPKQPPQ